MNWIRVSKETPCSVCEHPDWCTFNPELHLAHCMRVTSARPSKNSMGGYFHPLNGHVAHIPLKEPAPRVTIDACGMMRAWFSETERDQYDALGDALGVSANSLIALKCAWAPEHRAWAFPMRDSAGSVVGIRLRSMDGHKWSVRGGREGIFLPRVEAHSTAFIGEGPTDASALLTLGKFGIGRPSCSGGIAPLAATVARLGIRQAVIVADNDEDKVRPTGERWNPGLDGAQRLADEIGVPCCIVILPAKDARQFLSFGGTAELLDSLVAGLVWKQPKRNCSSTHLQNVA